MRVENSILCLCTHCPFPFPFISLYRSKFSCGSISLEPEEIFSFFFLAFLLMEICWPQVLSGIFILSSVVKDIFNRFKIFNWKCIFFILLFWRCLLSGLHKFWKGIKCHSFLCSMVWNMSFCSPCLYIWIFSSKYLVLRHVFFAFIMFGVLLSIFNLLIQGVFHKI